MADIFGRIDQVFGGGLSADSMFMHWSALKNDGVGLLVQSVSLQYAQPVRRIFELGPGTVTAEGKHAQYTYYVVGRPEGTFQMARIFGFAAISQEFYETYGSPCNQTPDLLLHADAGCNGTDNGSSSNWTLAGVIINGIAMNASAQEMLIQESVSAMFVNLKIDAVAAAGF